MQALPATNPRGLLAALATTGLALPASAAVTKSAAVAAPAAVTAPAVADAMPLVPAAIPKAPATIPKGWPTLRQGPNKTWPKVTVRSLQYLLDARGARLPADGVFGARTKAAVVAFQRAHHLTADGVAGPLTWQGLVNEVP